VGKLWKITVYTTTGIPKYQLRELDWGAVCDYLETLARPQLLDPAVELASIRIERERERT
jgi:hypothetical protein